MSRYQREEINRHTNRHEYHASFTETPAKKIFGARRRIPSGQRMHVETEKYTNKLQIMKTCPKCNETIKEAYFAAHLYQHLKNIDKNDYRVIYTCGQCEIKFFSRSSRDAHRKEKHKDLKKYKKLCTISKVYSDEEEDDDNMHGQAKATPPSRPTTPGILKKGSERIAKELNVESESMKIKSRPSLLKYDLDYMCDICKIVFPKDKRNMHRREHPERAKYKQLFVKIDFPNLARGQKANAEHVIPQKRKSKDHCNIAAAAKIQRRRMTYQERPNISDENYNNVKPAKIQKRSSTITKQSSINREENIVKKVTLFECGVCQIHFTKSSNIKWHILKGHPLEESRKCQKCGYYFSTDFSFHDEAHHGKSKLSRDYFSVLTFDENQFRKKLNAFLAESDEEEISEKKKDKEKSTPVESEQRSRMNETTSQTLENQGVERDNVSKEAMNSQSEKPLQTDLNNEQSGKNVDLNTIISNIFYKCKSCHMRYTLKNTMICDQCDLESSTESLKNQKKDAHHNDSGVEKNNFITIEHPPNDIVANAYVIQNKDEQRLTGVLVERNENNSEQVNTSLEKKKRKSHIKLYKCVFCEVHFAEISKCKTHIHNFFFDFEYKACGVCGLKFEQEELTEHMKIHHSYSFNLDDVEIIEVHSFALDSTQYVPTEDTVNNDMSSNTDNKSKKATECKEVNAEVHSLRQEKQNEINDINEKGSRCVLTPSAAKVHVPNINENIMVDTPRIPQRRGRRILSC